MHGLEEDEFSELRDWAQSQVGEIDESRLNLSRSEIRELLRESEVFRLENEALRKRLAGRRNLEGAPELQAKAIQNLAEGVLITESQPEWPDSQIIFANEGMREITGYAIEALIGDRPRLFHGPKTDSRVRAHIRERLKEGLSVRAEVVNHRKDGRPFEAELYVAPVMEDGEHVTHFVAIYSDISGRRQLSRELLERQSRLRAVLDTAVESIITINENGVIQDFNPAAEKLFDYRAEEVIGRNVKVLMPSPYREEHDGYLEAYLKTGVAKIIGIGREVEAQRRDGTAFPIDLSVSEFKVDGRPMFTGIIRDISERKAHEREARIWAEELERRVEEGTRELRLANQELRELNYFISHDLRAPLRAVRNYVDFLAEDLEGRVEGSTAEDLRHLQQANREMQAMVEDLLAYSRLSQGKTLTPAEIDVRHLVESIGSQLKGKSNHEVIAEGQLPRLNAPEVLVRQVFQNLIENGLKYNESETPEVRVSATRLEGDPAIWEFTFRDNGIGIDGKHHEEIFRMFRRLHTSERYVGTGIGLAGVNKAAQLLGGSVRLESSAGQGSTFYVELPEQAGGSPPFYESNPN